jgi:hypothetical protein
MLRVFVNCAKTVLPALTSAHWCYQKVEVGAFKTVNCGMKKKFIPSVLKIFSTHI